MGLFDPPENLIPGERRRVFDGRMFEPLDPIPQDGDLLDVLRWHLGKNLHPPKPLDFVDDAVRAIAYIKRGLSPNTTMVLVNGKTTTAHEVMDVLCLQDFLTGDYTMTVLDLERVQTEYPGTFNEFVDMLLPEQTSDLNVKPHLDDEF